MLQTFLVLEDFEETREWLSSRLKEAFNDARVSGAGTLAEARTLLDNNNYDMALVDLNLPDGKGSEFIKYLTKNSPDTYCIVVTAFNDDEHLFPALKAGAQGYLLKDQTAEEFTVSLRGVLHGEPAISTSIARKLIDHFHVVEQEPAKENLSSRESEILSLTAKGLTRIEISNYLLISPNTVASHLKNVYSKLNVSNRAEATLEALRLGLV